MKTTHWNRLALRCVLPLALLGAASAPPASAQDRQGHVVQDGIAVKPLPKGGATGFWRDLTAPEDAINQQSAQQYLTLMSQARDKGVLAPANDLQLVRLRAIAARIIPNTVRWNAEAQGWKWEVNLLKSGQVNAFCMPGGRIAFFTGILDKLKLTDDEIAHALREHGRDRQSKATATGLVSQLGGAALSAWLGVDVRGASNALGQMVVLKFSRDEEREADLIGLDIAARSGYDPRAGLALWTKMAALNERGAPPALLSDHPGGAERMQQIQAHMNVLLPLYARAKGMPLDRLPPYRSNVALR